MQVVNCVHNRSKLYALLLATAWLGCGSINDAPAAVMSGILPDANYGSLQLWLDVDSLPTSSTSIASWQDKSSNGFDATQINPSQQPTYVTSNAAFSNWPTVHFDGSDDRMSAGLASAMSINGALPRTIFVAFKQDALLSKNVVGYGADGAGQTFDLLPFGSGGAVIIGHMYGGGFDTIAGTSQTYSANQLTVATIDYDGATVNLYQHDQSFNGPLNSKAMALNTSDSAIQIGAGSYAPYNLWNGDIAEILIYDEVLSSVDRMAVDNYLFSKYSMTPEEFHALLIIPAPEPGTGLLVFGAVAISLARYRKRRTSKVVS